MPNNYLSVLYKHNSSGKLKYGVKSVGGGGTIIPLPPNQKGGGHMPPCPHNLKEYPMWRQRVSSLAISGPLPCVGRHITVNKMLCR